MLLSIAIISYILSLVLALVFVFTAKKLNRGWFKMVGGIHIVLAVFFLFTLFGYSAEARPPFAFLLFFCSGIIMGGLAFGMNKALPFKVYFGLFDVSVLIFLLSPSTVLNFLVTASFGGKEKPIAVYGSYFLEEQNTMSKDVEKVQYKLIRKAGMFHQTITRNIEKHSKQETKKEQKEEKNKAKQKHKNSGRKTFVSDEVDSTDVNINLN